MSPQLKVLKINGFSGDEASAGVRVGQTFDLLKDRISFGRCQDNDIPLYAFDKPRHHGQFIKVGEDYVIEEFPSIRFPVWVNNSPIEGKTLLKDGDIIAIFMVKLEFRTRGFPQA